MTQDQPDAFHPTGIAAVMLRVRDVARLAAFYEITVGLTVLPGATADAADLGTDEDVLLRLCRTDEYRPEHRTGGLFHTAFLLPHRAALAAWLRSATDRKVPVIGASDHGVSEAVYLADPEGNGIEIYADRPKTGWRDAAGRLRMPSDPLDAADLLAERGTAWTRAPAGTRIGHVHLSVGDVAGAERFWTGQMGLSVTTRYPGATFLGWDGYHHHVAVNAWGVRAAPVPAVDAPGLAAIAFRGWPLSLEGLRDPGTGAVLSAASH